ncbi:MAG: hypothetical protein AB8C46_11040 [Burkholderiaceae bacterium]
MTLPADEPEAFGPQTVVISLYDQRPLEPLQALFNSMKAHDAGLPYELLLVINRDDDQPLDLPEVEGLRVVERANKGMNIGAWDHGWRQCPQADGFLFLQDECLITRPGWLLEFARWGQAGAALTGESLNPAWDRPWADLRQTHGQTDMPGHQLNGQQANRIDIYLAFMRRHGIHPGRTARHLRSLVWYAQRPWLERIDGFAIGEDFGECIGAEIGTSRAVEAAGGRLEQVSAEPFSFIRHLEWHRAYPGGPFVHGLRSPRRAGLLDALRMLRRPRQFAGLVNKRLQEARRGVMRRLAGHDSGDTQP